VLDRTGRRVDLRELFGRLGGDPTDAIDQEGA
jgi:hypothetical protein